MNVANAVARNLEIMRLIREKYEVESDIFSDNSVEARYYRQLKADVDKVEELVERNAAAANDREVEHVKDQTES